MTSLNFKLAFLSVLARLPERRAMLGEIRQEIQTIVVNQKQTEQLKRFALLGDIDIFRSGLVSRDHNGFQITEAGLSLLHSLEGPSQSSEDAFSTSESHSFKLIDDLIGTKERLKIFDLEPRTFEADDAEGSDDQSEPQQGNEAASIEAPDAALETSTTDRSGTIDPRTIVGAVEDEYDQPSVDAPTFLRQSFGSKAQEPDWGSSPRPRLFASIATKTRSIFAPWGHHFVRADPTPTERETSKAGGVAFAFLSLLVLISCAGTAIAIGQIKALKSEIATLHQDLLPLRERVGKLEQTEKKRESDQQETVQTQSVAETNKPGEGNRTEQAGLSLSREEIELIRNYIKPAPSAAPSAPAINIGDPVGDATIPLPSQLMEKIPKLLGARFTTRNGAIIIVKRDSRQADTVLPPN